MKLQISLSAKILKSLERNEFGMHQLNRAYSQWQTKIGEWKHVPYSDKFAIEVVKRKTGYSLYVRDLSVDEFGRNMIRFVAFMHLDHEDFRSSVLYEFFTPIVFTDPRFRGQGLIKPLYKWVLDNGLSLISDHKQSKYSNSIWRALALKYKHISFPYNYKVPFAPTLNIEDDALISAEGFRTIMFASKWTQAKVDNYKLRLLDSKPWN